MTIPRGSRGTIVCAATVTEAARAGVVVGTAMPGKAMINGPDRIGRKLWKHGSQWGPVPFRKDRARARDRCPVQPSPEDGGPDPGQILACGSDDALEETACHGILGSGRGALR